MEVKAYEILLKHIYRDAPIGLCFFDTDLRYQHINEWLASLNGLSVKDHLGRLVSEVIPDASARIESILRSVIESGKPVLNDIVEAESKALPHQKRILQHCYHAARSDEGTVVGVSCTVEDITERTEAEETFRQSQFAVDHSSNPIYWVRKDGGITYANEAACRSLGYTRDELLLMSVTQIDSDFPEEVWPANWQDMKRNKRSTFEAHHRRKDGHVFPVQITTNFLEYKSQEFIWAYVTDISARKQAAESLRDSEARFQTMFETAAIPMVLCDINGKFFETNPAFQSLLGYTHEQLVGLKFTDITHPEDIEKSLILLKQLVAGERSQIHIEKRYIHKDGSVILANTTASGVYDSEGRFQYLVGMIQDITSSRQAEKSSRASESRFRGLLEAESDGVIVVDEQGTIDLVNAPAAEMFGYRREELQGESIDLLVPMRLREQHAVRLAGFMNKPYPRPMGVGLEVIGSRKDDSEFPMEVSLSPLQTDEGMFVMSIIRDITERKQAEDALITQAETERLLRRELDHRVRNNLASLISLIDMSRTGVDNVEAFAESIKGRTQTIASVHAALSSIKWKAIDLHTLLHTLLVTEFEDRFSLDGLEVIIPTEQAQALGLVAHELATNCRKHGALCRPGGSVAVNWELKMPENSGRKLLIHWQESGGPPIEAEPEPGTGMSLIRGLVKSELQGQIDFGFPKKGAVHAISLTLTEDSKAQYGAMALSNRVDVKLLDNSRVTGSG